MNNIKTNFPTSEFDQYLSFCDVELIPGWMEAWKAQDQEKVEEILYSAGVDIQNGYEVEINTHRTRLTQKIEYGPRFSFSERQDKVWKESGMSIEDQIRNCGDISLQNMLSGMNKFGFGKCDTVKTVEQLASEF
jgi:hypothetical protein